VRGRLVDTDVLVDHFRGFRRFQPDARPTAYSVITRCELLAGRAADEQAIGLVLDAMREHPVDRAVAELAGRLRRRYGLRTPDALIAATAVAHDLTLVTRNTRDFEPVRELTVQPPA